MGVTLSPELQRRIELKVISGESASAEEVMIKALALLNDREEKLAWLRREIQVGIDQLDRGEYSDRPIEEIIAEARRRFVAKSNK